MYKLTLSNQVANITIFLGWLFANEPLTVDVFISMFIILTAVALINTDLSKITNKIKRIRAYNNDLK